MKRTKHHHHIVLDDTGQPLPLSIEHDHLVTPGRRHAHYRDYDKLLAELRAQGVPDIAARALAMRLDRTAYTTFDFDRLPEMGARQVDERGIAARLHPEVRRSLT